MSYTAKTHNTSYPSISPTLPALSAEGKVVLITGASSGIGRATAAAFAEAGAKAIVLLARREAALAEVATALSSSSPAPKVLYYAADVADEAGMRAALDDAAARLGGGVGVDIVVHSAATQGEVGLLAGTGAGAGAGAGGGGAASPEGIWAAFETNVKGGLVVARAAVAARASVLVVLNTAGAVMPPLPGLGAYLASKAGLAKLMEYVAAENPGLRVVQVHPGVVRTDAAVALEEKMGIKFPYDDMSLASSFIVWAASDEAAFLRGKFVFANWDVDELKARSDEIQAGTDLTLGSLVGFPRA